MISRKIKDSLLRFAKQYPVVTLTGPRQSGKTTLCRNLFPDYQYRNLEDLELRTFAIEDPKGFLKQCKDHVILDEIQRVPELLSYIQVISDEKKTPGQFILTGSHHFDLLSSVTQSLAGRTAIATLLPFSYEEIYENRSIPTIEEMLYKGFYPRIFDQNLVPTEAYSFYTTTYIERDLRNIIHIKDLKQFEIFLKSCAARTGQILNMTSLGNDCGLSHNTVKQWLSLLESSYIIKLLQPYYKNYQKRLVKSPKLYFLDTGLVSYLLGIQKPEHLASHPLKGALFETFAVTELLKGRFNRSQGDNLYYFRDNNGNEVDILMDMGSTASAIEVKLGQTIQSDLFKGLHYLNRLSSDNQPLSLIYGGETDSVRNGIHIYSWRNVRKILEQI